MMFHTLSWCAWLAAAAVSAFTLRNPLYLALTLVASWIVYSALGRRSPIGSSWGSFAKIGLFFLVLTIPINALSIHSGRMVLFRLPDSWPIVGGIVTLEATIAGAVNGLSLLTILMVFATFNGVVDHYQLLRATPAFLFHAGVVVSIAITFVPQMVLGAKEIREAQRIRGHRFRGIRDLLPLVLPLLANGLERAIQLAETMEARGFASAIAPVSQRRVTLTRLGSLAGLLGLLLGLFVATYLPDWRGWGWVLAALGTAGVLVMFRLQGGRIHRTRYRRVKWLGRDTALTLGSCAVVAILVVAKTTVPQMLTYSPYPPYSLVPPFQALVGAALLLLVLPAILAPAAVYGPAGKMGRGTPGAHHEPPNGDH
jgi:energy-coupling factor transport system permease protein